MLITTASKTSSEVWFVPTATPAADPRVVAAAVARPRVLGGAPLRRASTATGSSSSRTRVTRATSSSSRRRYPIRAKRRGPRSSRIATTSASKASMRSSITSCSRERYDGLDPPRGAPRRGRCAPRDLLPRPGVHGVGRPERGVRDRDPPVRLHLARRAGDRRRLRPGNARRDRREDATGAAATTTRPRTRRRGSGSTQSDGERVPISVVHRKDVPLDGTAPALLYGYGSYEISMDATFRASRLSLLDRGFVYAIAHVRGGGELGRRWYEGGRLEQKRNTFTDFIGCAEALVAGRYTSPDRLAARGGSAGGLLMGAIANLRPDLFAAIVAEVPFVDVVTTMLDEELPLTITEWEEWGDPREADAYEWMKSYSPYDNVAPLAYPTMLVTAGLNDPRVQYWEPAKWVAKLRGRVDLGAADHPAYRARRRARGSVGALRRVARGSDGPRLRVQRGRGHEVTDAGTRRAAHRRRRRPRGRVRAAARGHARNGGAVPSAPAIRRNDAQHRRLGAVRGAARGRLRLPALQLPRRRGQRGEPRRRPDRTRGRARRARGGARVRPRRGGRRGRLVVRRRHGALGGGPAHRRLGRHRAAAAIRQARSPRSPRTRGRSIWCSRSTTTSATRAKYNERSRRGRTSRPKSFRAPVTSSRGAPTGWSTRPLHSSRRCREGEPLDRERCGSPSRDARGTSSRRSNADCHAARSSSKCARSPSSYACSSSSKAWSSSSRSSRYRRKKWSSTVLPTTIPVAPFAW